MTDEMNYNTEEFGAIKTRCENLVQEMGSRDTQCDKMERIFLMDWDEEAEVARKQENIRITKSPDPRNKTIGALRLLAAGDPAFSVPEEKNVKSVVDISDKLERWATVLWRNMGRVRQNPLHYDIVLSLLLWSEVHIGITKTSDLVERAKGGDPVAYERAKELENRTPFLADVWHPKDGYPEFGPTGLNSFYRRVKVTSGQILDEYGDEAVRQLGGTQNRYAEHELNIFWDHKIRYDWMTSAGDRPLWFEEHGLPNIPVIAMLGEGSMLFEDPEDQRQPFLFAAYKSDLWKRQNLAMTVLYTTMYSLGTNPQYLFHAIGPERELDIDWSTPGGVAQLLPGEDFKALDKNLNEPAIIAGLELADRMVSESTIYSQTLGEPLGGNAPYSMVAMLHQAGRLPLLMTQRKGSWAIADVVKLCLQWWKKEGGKTTSDIYGGLMAKEVPSQFELEAKLDIALPQDRLQQANTARVLTDGERPLVSRRYAREEFIGIEQPDQMVEDIWDENAADLRAKEHFLMEEEQILRKQEELFQRKMALQQQQQQMMQGPPPGMQGPPGMPPGMPPEMPPQQGPPGMPPGGPPMGPSPEEMMGGNQGPMTPPVQLPQAPVPQLPKSDVEPI